MDCRSESGARGEDWKPSCPSSGADAVDVRPLFQTQLSEGAKRRYLLKLRNAAFQRLRDRPARQQQT